MSGKAFLDTNVFVYAYDNQDPIKRALAADFVRDAASTGEGAISYQVIQEFLNWALTKAASKMSHADAQQVLATTFRPFRVVAPSLELCSQAIRLHERYRLNWYDGLIVAAALEAGCAVLYSEDLQDGQKFGALTVRNPFRAAGVS